MFTQRQEAAPPPGGVFALRKLLVLLGSTFFGLALLAGVSLAQPVVTGVVATDVEEVEVTFDVNVDPTTGGDATNYQIFERDTPVNTIPVDAALVVGNRVTLTLGATLDTGLIYTLRSAGIEPLGGGTPSPVTQTDFSGGGGPLSIPIADIQADPAAYTGQVVTVEGVVYVPSDYRGATTSGFIQDESNRGINLFGTGFDVPATQTVGNRVRVTGTVELYFTTVEITNPTAVTVLASGQPRPDPVQLGTGAAANAQWEGTFIEVTGTITTQVVGGPGINYTVNDGSGPIVVRVVDTLGAPTFTNGTTITARGAGGQFSTDFQVLVGLTSDVFEQGGAQFSVTGATAVDATTVTVGFSAAVDATTGSVAGNYAVYETAVPANTVAVSSASVSGASVTLTLGASLIDGTGYTVEVTGVEDNQGTVVGANNTATFTYTVSTATPIADIQANPGAYEGQVVTVEGVVYVPSDYRGATTSGYIQDESNRGINLFGTGFDVPATQTVGNRVRVTGTVELYFTTVEITNPTAVTVLASGQPRPDPVQLGTGAAANAQWEGTFIEVTGPITTQVVGGPGINYTVNDGSGPIVVRVVDTLGAPTFTNGTTVTARGAGGQFQTDFQVLVGLASDVFEGTGGDLTPPRVTGASGASATSVTVNFSEALDPTTAQTPGNYQVFETATPANTLAVTAAALTGSRVTLTLGVSMTEGTSYTVVVQNVEDLAGNVIAEDNTAVFTYSASNVVPIADIHADLDFYEGQVVTVEGVVYIPTDYRGSTTSGYIQDASGRGINLFGSGMNVPALTTLGNQVRITGTVELFFTTVEITNPTEVTLLGTGSRPAPEQLSTDEASSSDWEGTFIEVTGTITSQGVGGPGINYTVNDGSGPIVVRVVDTLGAPAFDTGATITARGAGGFFSPDYQVNVGVVTDIFEGTGGDITPPRVTRASLETATTVFVDFNEPVEPTSATDADNYTVFRTGNPAETRGVSSVAGVGSQRVRLTLDGSIAVSEGWSVRVVGVADAAGNAIPAPGVTAEIEELLVDKIDLSGPPFTFLPRDGERYPLEINLTSELTDSPEEGEHPPEVILRIFDMNGTLVKSLYDSRVSPVVSEFNDNRATFEWDGTDEYGEWVPAGAYIAHLQVRVARGSNPDEVHIPVVVATRLDR